ncbi:hypothetical protein [Nonomuraea soli]|uniref:Protein kinase domain-containing protein n=1 Tax=Nonomuraea soli TaxID=1032476 RepID=A0A7W0HR59_9ACTN|nr:hypothetical protein [Nonomuraea soli]MBA2892659.1 hypothetical protein [Nonomuraea soli]
MQSLAEHDPRQVGPYLLRARLGDDQDAGFLALAPDGSKVTLRVLREGARFIREVEDSLRADPGWMARVLDADVEGSLTYIVSEYGEDQDPAASRELVGPASALARGLAAIHRAGIGEPADVFDWGRVVYLAATGDHATTAPDLSLLPEQLRAPVRAALARKPSARPSAAELLVRLSDGEPAPAPRRFKRTQLPLLAGSAAALTAAVLVVSALPPETAGCVRVAPPPTTPVTTPPPPVDHQSKPRSAFPAEATTPTTRVYYNFSRAKHQARMAELVVEGFRLTSLTLSRGERYTAVWTRAPGPQQRFFTGLSSTATSRFLAESVKQGYRIKLIAGTGSWRRARYSGVMIRQRTPYNLCFWRLTEKQFVARNRAIRARGDHTLRWVNVYGPPGDRRYAAVWEPDEGAQEWTTTVDQSWSTVRRWQRAHPDHRPLTVAASPDRRYTVVWRKAKARTFMYGDAARVRTAPRGYRPVSVQVAGTAARPYFTALWTR